MQEAGTATAPSFVAPDEPFEFSGDFERTIDEKGRVVIPPSFRPAFADGGFLRTWPGPCLALWTPDGFRKIADTLRDRRREKLGNPNARRALYAGAPRVAPDGQGRLFLPEKLRVSVGIENEIVVVGSGEYVELWAPSHWEPIYDDGEVALFDEIQTELGY